MSKTKSTKIYEQVAEKLKVLIAQGELQQG
ncbi:MAG TPA: FadR family transcriptional regulator, partial [Aminobacterium sp.]|nr:FadR family transcriptional regulator [Aminobacterium sp.]